MAMENECARANKSLNTAEALCSSLRNQVAQLQGERSALEDQLREREQQLLEMRRRLLVEQGLRSQVELNVSAMCESLNAGKYSCTSVLQQNGMNWALISKNFQQRFPPEPRSLEQLCWRKNDERWRTRNIQKCLQNCRERLRRRASLSMNSLGSVRCARS